MKNLFPHFGAFLLAGALGLSTSAIAQKADDGEIKIKIVKEEDGKKEVHTETINMEDFDLEKMLDGIDINIEGFDISDISNILEDINLDIDVEIEGEEGGEQKVITKIKHFDLDDSDQSQRPFLGVHAKRTYINGEQGALTIDKVVEGSAAAKAELQAGDVITQIDGKAVSSHDDLVAAIGQKKVGDNMSVTVNRGGKTINKKVVLGAHEGSSMIRTEIKKWMDAEGNEFEFNVNGDIDKDFKIKMLQEAPKHAFLGVRPGAGDDKAAVVGSVVDGSAAQKAALKSGDKITKVNNTSINSFDDLIEAMRALKPGDVAKIQYERDGKSQQAKVELGAPKHANKIMIKHCDDKAKSDCAKKCEKTVIKECKGGMDLKHPDNAQVDVTVNEDGSTTKVITWTDKDGKKVKKVINTLEMKEGENHFEDKDVKIMMFKADGDTDVESLMEELKEEYGDQMKVITKIVDGEDDAAQKQEVRMEIKNDLKMDLMEIFPNPNQGIFTLKIALATEGATTIEVFDMSGKNIYREEIAGFSGERVSDIDISAHPAGTYIIKVSQNGQSAARKVVLK